MTQVGLFERGDWSVRIETHAEMVATATDFLLKAHVECWDAGHPFHRVDWHHKIPRNGM